eukprot:1959237-Karenia_brevis.AAC.1
MSASSSDKIDVSVNTNFNVGVRVGQFHAADGTHTAVEMHTDHGKHAVTIEHTVQEALPHPPVFGEAWAVADEGSESVAPDQYPLPNNDCQKLEAPIVTSLEDLFRLLMPVKISSIHL